MRPPRRIRVRKRHGDELRAIVDETLALGYLLRFVGEQIKGGTRLTEAQRGLLRGIVRYGARTVPQLARARGVTRQHTQVLVDRLAARRLVELAPNPAHRRSRLVRATSRGIAVSAAMDEADARALALVGARLTSNRAELATTARVLREIRERFEAR